MLLPNLIFAVNGKYNTNFKSPVKYKIAISGSFGEIRANHFHSGIDIRSNNGGSGDSIFSAESGYVSRIKIDRSGYGRSLYITHPNGFTTVYAHLLKFNQQIEEYVLSYQKSMMSYELDIKPEEHLFYVDQSEHVGFLGNSGHSFGAHLHFEIRETSSDKPINPYHFGIKPIDHIAPDIAYVRVTGLTPEFEKVCSHKFPNKKDKSGYTIVNEMEIPAWRVGVSVKAFDKCNGCVNKNGIYKIEVLADDTLFYSFNMDEFGFVENQYLEAHTDFEAKQKENATEMLCYKLPGNKLNIIDHFHNDGLIPLHEGLTKEITVKVYDFDGNIEIQKLRLRRAAVKTLISESNGEKIYCGEEKVLYCDKACAIINPNCLSKNDHIQFYNTNYFSQIPSVRISSANSPLLAKMKLAIKIPDSLMYMTSKMTIVKTSSNRSCNGSIISQDTISTYIDEFGEYSLYIDTIPPTIKPIAFSEKAKTEFFKFKIEDNVYTRAEAKDFTYHVFVDQEWIPCEYKENVETLYVPIGKLINGDHSIKITAEDQFGNRNEWNGVFKK